MMTMMVMIMMMTTMMVIMMMIMTKFSLLQHNRLLKTFPFLYSCSMQIFLPRTLRIFFPPKSFTQARHCEVDNALSQNLVSSCLIAGRDGTAGGHSHFCFFTMTTKATTREIMTMTKTMTKTLTSELSS